MAIYALFIALIGIATFTPIGYLPLGIATITTLHVFVLLMAFLTDTKGGFIAGLAFGIFSFIRALTMPASPTDVLFQNPIVSVLPRALFGLIAGFVATKLNKKYGNDLVKKTVLMVISSVILTFIHSAMVLPLMYLFAPTVDAFKNFWNENTFLGFFGSILLANGLLEMAEAGIVVPLCVVPLSKVLDK